MTLCKYNDCGREHYRNGLCRAHDNRRYKAIAMDAPIRQYRRQGQSAERNADGYKHCSTCSVWQDPSNYHKSAGSIDGLRSRCKKCDYKYNVKRVYNLEWSDYERMLEGQNGACAICKRLYEKLNVDHDHSCCPGKRSCGKCVRALLCTNCNSRIGWYEANKETIIAYL